MSNLQCPQCATTYQIGDRFCEECGTSLVVLGNTDGCEKCGAAVTEIDADGFCSYCGFRREKRENDRFELIISTRLAAVSDRGLRHHQNEDFMACAEVDGGYVMVVCDGVSSSESPELASKAAANAVCGALVEGIKDDGTAKGTKDAKEELMRSAIESAMTAVSAVAYKPVKSGEAPSTTVVAAVVVDGVVSIGWMGDSRAYWISPSGSRQLSKDDSWFNDVVSSGEMSEIEAHKSPNAHAITRWLGADAVDIQPSIIEFQIPDSGYLLLCSDGLWNYAEELTQMEAIVKQHLHADVGMTARGLVEFARSRGGHDNITVAILDCGNQL
jgi:PPM family protein phosphatase